MTDGLRHPNDGLSDVTVTFTSKQATFVRQALGVALNRAPGVFDAEQIDALTDADAALREGESNELEAIVRDLAARDLVADIDPDYSVYACLACPDEHDESYRSHAEVVHAESCPWRRAREWVADHPAEGHPE